MKNSRFAPTRGIVVSAKVNRNRPGTARAHAYELALRSRTIAEFRANGGNMSALVTLVNKGALRLRDIPASELPAPYYG